MLWTLAKRSDLKNLISFLQKDEWQHVQAFSCFFESDDYIYPKKSHVITIIKKVNGNIEGAIIITCKGLIYPIFQKESLGNPQEKEELIKILATINLKIHGVIGLAQNVDFFDTILFNKIRGINNYLILHRQSINHFKTDNNLIIKKATIADLNKLIPLEYEYQKEEVLLDPKELNTKATTQNFKNKLLNDEIYFIEGKNIPISKVGTTYQSPNYTLIGGVFTWKERRNKGYGTELLKHLINQLSNKGKKGALFVKDKNTPALHLYKKLGFIQPLPYKINYYYN